jgi:serine/threonine-protein kinase
MAMLESPSPEFIALQRAVAGRYSLERELGRGGMGIVFLARDVALDRPVAIKLLPLALAELGEYRERFLREARTAAKLSHPHIVPIHAVEEDGDLVFFVMAYVEGETLGQRIRRAGPVPPHEIMRITQEVAWALGHAHAHGVVHRDVKPDNVLLERGSGRALVSDFGIARWTTGEDTPRSGVVGTPQYMSPEQAAGEPVDPRSDLYSLGVTAYYAASGRHPFEAHSVAGLLAKHAGAEPPPVASQASNLSPGFAGAIDRCLAKSPGDRPESADALATRIDVARGSVLQLPPPMRAFLRDADAAGGEISTVLTAGAMTATVYFAVFARDLFAGIVFIPAVTLMVGLAGARLAQLAFKARDLVRQGYGHAALPPAVAVEDQRRLEEAEADPAQRHGMTRETWAVVGIGTAKTALSLWLASLDIDLLWIIGAAGSIIIPTATIRKVWSDVRRGRPGFWNRLLSGKLGRLMFKIAGIGVSKQVPEVPVAGQSTTIALGAAARELYRALPAAVRSRFPSLPTLIERLERDATALRSGKDDARAQDRFATAVAALENLRLDLLRLHAGTATVDELTAHLEQARKMGEEIDAELEARDQVRHLLARPKAEAPSTG